MSTPSFSSVLHNGTYRTRYLFNGKELDTETNLYYYGARYFEPREILWYGVDPLTEKYPFNSGYVYCNGNPVKYVDLWGENPTEEEAARMSAHVYGDQPDDILIGGWKVSNKAEELGITLTHNKSGFKSQLYERTNKDGETEYTYAFAGTDFDQVNDWANNAAPEAIQNVQIRVDVAGRYTTLNSDNNWSSTISGIPAGEQTATVTMTNGTDAAVLLAPTSKDVQITKDETTEVSFNAKLAGTGRIPVTINWNNAPEDVRYLLT